MSRAPHRLSNEEIASQLEEVAELLRVQDGDHWRIRAFREAAGTLRAWAEPVVEVLDREGQPGLIAIPTIGRSIAAAIEEMAFRGRWSMLDRLRGEVTPEEVLMTLPGMGETLAHRVHDQLGVETLEDLEVAAHDGTLERVEGFGPRRARAVRDLLATQLGRSTRRRNRRVSVPPAAASDEAPPAPLVLETQPAETRPREASGSEGARGRPAVQQDLPAIDAEPHAAPSIDLLLAVDAEYRRRASDGELPTIAPRRFNPDGERWLPIWHVTEEGFHFTALFSNSATAHRLDKTHDWVVIYWERDGHEAQATVVTEYRGPLAGRRVVRGRERECLSYWARDTERRLWEERWRRTA